MREVLVSELQGNEVLGLPVIAGNDTVLVHADVILKNEWICKLQEYGIEKVFVKSVPGTSDFTMEETKEHACGIVKKIFERHIYKQDGELKEVAREAANIVNEILENPAVMNELTEVRKVSTDVYSHCINVCTLSVIMAVRLRMSRGQINNIALGAILHDIGLRYVTVPYYNVDIERAGGRTALEYKKHTIYGYTAVQSESWMSEAVKEIILFHHEREDGSGYPMCQVSSRLSVEVKLVAICDAFDSFISGVGNRQMKIYEAVEYMRVQAGNVFETAILNKLLASVALYPVGTRVVTSEGEIGIVHRQNEVSDRPVLKMLFKADGTLYGEDVYMDLMKVLTVFIVDIKD